MIQRTFVGCVLAGFLFCVNANGGETLNVGDDAPRFTLSYATKDTIVANGFSLADAIGAGNIILAFYPANWSRGCTKEMCTLRDNFALIGELGAQVVGISGDYLWSHREWARSLNLSFALLSDHDHAVAKMYHSYSPETGYNKRTIFVIDTRGKLAYIDWHYSTASEESFLKLQKALAELQPSGGPQ